MATDDQSKTAEMSKVAEIFYRVFFDELRFAKQQQFTITNYTLLLMAGVFAVAKVISPTTPGKIILCGLIGAAWAVGLVMLCDLQGYMREIRRRQTDMQQNFSPEDQSLARGDKPSGAKQAKDIYQCIRSHSIFGQYEPFLVALCFVVTIAGLLAGYAVAALKIS
jgi:hypothetical protein